MSLVGGAAAASAEELELSLETAGSEELILCPNVTTTLDHWLIGIATASEWTT